MRRCGTRWRVSGPASGARCPVRGAGVWGAPSRSASRGPRCSLQSASAGGESVHGHGPLPCAGTTTIVYETTRGARQAGPNTDTQLASETCCSLHVGWGGNGGHAQATMARVVKKIHVLPPSWRQILTAAWGLWSRSSLLAAPCSNHERPDLGTLRRIRVWPTAAGPGRPSRRWGLEYFRVNPDT